MKHTSFQRHECPIAWSLEQVGEWWTMLILRDVFDGFNRFDQFQASLGIAPNMLARRLKSLVDSGLLERHQYQDRPPRYEYHLTDRGREFRPVIHALYAWGNQHRTEEERCLIMVDQSTGNEIDPVLIDRASGKALDDVQIDYVAGPGASPSMRHRLERARELRRTQETAKT